MKYFCLSVLARSRNPSKPPHVKRVNSRLQHGISETKHRSLAWTDDRGWDGWMASLTRWTWVSVNSGSWWWTGRPGVLRFMGSQRVGHDWATDLIWSDLKKLLETKDPFFDFQDSYGQSIGNSLLYMDFMLVNVQGRPSSIWLNPLSNLIT